jgi:hypothetical protein
MSNDVTKPYGNPVLSANKRPARFDILGRSGLIPSNEQPVPLNDWIAFGRLYAENSGISGQIAAWNER